ncbi:benzoate transport [Orbus hercynius]|uniref:Benzoate transport n=1 Tax=Orbus hercynius TaxID=593135 RepID=A0A495RCV9_9GAMM|nr:MFS transporter [Orbus hercynius]RKS85205.1 benzoate transport [Orbus hercynius]
MDVSEIKQTIYHGKMNHFQILVITICVLISLIDGFDVLTIAFVAPSISTQWELSPEQLGVLFSAGLVGMVLGALVISPFADKLGRRVIILCCLVILTIGMFASGLAMSHTELVIARIFTGLGMGAILPGINTVVAEYSSNRYRSLAISFMAAGYTVGALIGGVFSIYLIKYFGWQSVFYFGGIFSAIMIGVVFYQLPESLDFILGKNSHKNLTKLNHLLGKLGLQRCDSFPKAATSQAEVQHFNLLLTPKMLKATILLCVSNFMLMCSFYFLANWTPKILVNLGYSNALSITGSLLMNIFGIAGGILLGWFSKKYSVQKASALMLIVAFIAVTLFGFSANLLPLLFTLIAFIGFTIYGAMAGLYATAPIVFPPQIRATGTGIVLGLARLGAALGPYIAGLLIAAELPRGCYFFILALPLLIAASCIYIIKPYCELPD